MHSQRSALPALVLPLVIIATAVLAYHGVFLLGHGTDSPWDQEMYRTLPLSTVAANPVYNRYPLWGLVVYPLVLAMPLWAAHTVVIAAHTLAAVLFFALLRAWRLPDITAALAAITYLLWPAHAESLFWLSGGMFAFGALFLVAGALAYAHGRPLLAVPLLFGAMLFSEGLFFPTLLMVLVLLVHRRRIVEGISVGGTLVALYALFQAVRYTAAGGRDFSPYGFSLERAGGHFREWSRMAFGLASSQDVAWMWMRAAPSQDSGLLLPPLYLALALGFALGLTLLLLRGGRPANPLPLPLFASGMVICLAWFVASALIFLVVSRNDMQARYTTVAALAIAAALALLVSPLLLQRSRALMLAGTLAATLLIGYPLYRAWSNVWVNGVPAHLLNQALIADMRAAAAQHPGKPIFVIDDPRAVGNAFALGREWGYVPTARQFVGPDVEANNEVAEGARQRADFGPGMLFSSRPCVFLGWRDGQRFISQRVLANATSLVMNCATGVVEQVGPTPPKDVFYFQNPSRYNLATMLGLPLETFIDPVADPFDLNKRLRSRTTQP
ncbi:MAG: hypothetical protein H7Z42_05355 [Roseiflexaceae bacterium]|nr:hypothetical protein [Roseiflexaceae bacterium]